MPGPAAGSSPDQIRTRSSSPRSWPTDVSPRALAADDRVQLALDVGDLAAQLVVAGGQVRDQEGQVLRGLGLEARPGLLGPELDHDEQPQQEGDGGEGELAPSAGASVRAPACGLGAGGRA